MIARRVNANPGAAAIARRRGVRRASPVLPALTLNMTAMIDCVFMLLMFFILTADFRPREDSLAVDPSSPEAGATAVKTADAFALPDRPVTITVRSTGDGAIDYTLTCDEPALGAFTSFDELESRARASRGATLPAEQEFAVTAAADTRWEHALGAMNALQQAGFARVRLTRPGGGS